MKPEADKKEIIRGTNAERLALPTTNLQIGTRFFEKDLKVLYIWDGINWLASGVQTISGGAAKVADGFKPSSYDLDLTMDDIGQAVALATGVKLGAGRIHVVNRGAATEAVRVAFGINAGDAITNLTVAALAATTGYYIPAIADGTGEAILGAPALTTHYAIANAVAADRQVVSITQGV